MLSTCCFQPYADLCIACFLCAVLSNKLFWRLFRYSLLDALFLIWLFPSSVLSKVPICLLVMFSSHWLLFVCPCVRSPNLAICSQYQNLPHLLIYQYVSLFLVCFMSSISYIIRYTYLSTLTY